MLEFVGEIRAVDGKHTHSLSLGRSEVTWRRQLEKILGTRKNLEELRRGDYSLATTYQPTLMTTGQCVLQLLIRQGGEVYGKGGGSV